MKNLTNEKAEQFLFFEYLVFSDDIYKDIKFYENKICDIDFISFLYVALTNIKENNIYPSKVFINLKMILNKLLEFINQNRLFENSDLVYKLIELYNSLNIDSSYNIYSREMNIKFDNVLERASKDFCIWNVSDIEESIRYDYFALSNIKKCDNSIFINDEKFILFVKKIICIFPKIFLDKEIKNKVLNILNKNSDLSKESEYYLDIIYNITKRNYKYNFQIIELINYYKTIYLEQLLIQKDIIIDTQDITLLEHVYRLIDDNYIGQFYDLKMKNNIINIMNEFREKYFHEKNFLIEYNKYLVKLNETESNGNILYDIINKRMTIKEQLENIKENFLYNNREEMIKNLMSTLEFDYEVMKSLLCDEETFNLYKDRFYDSLEYTNTISKMIIENPTMFKNYDIKKRTIIILESIKKYSLESDFFDKENYKKTVKNIKILTKYY